MIYKDTQNIITYILTTKQAYTLMTTHIDTHTHTQTLTHSHLHTLYTIHYTLHTPQQDGKKVQYAIQNLSPSFNKNSVIICIQKLKHKFGYRTE